MYRKRLNTVVCNIMYTVKKKQNCKFYEFHRKIYNITFSNITVCDITTGNFTVFNLNYQSIQQRTKQF